MKKIIYIAAIFSFLLTATSCSEDAFTQVVTFDIPKEPAKLVVTSDYLNSSDSMQVFISSSWNIGGELPKDSLKKCKVELLEGTKKIADIPYILSQNIASGGFNTGQSNSRTYQAYYMAKIPTKLADNQSYTLRVSAVGFETVEAKSTMPKTVAIKKVIFTKNGFKGGSSGPFGNGGGSTIDLIAVEFDDAIEENFYNMEVIKMVRDTQTNELYKGTSYFSLNQKFSADPFGEDDYSRSFNFTDEIFNGKTFVFKIGIDTEDTFIYSGNTGNSKGSSIVESYEVRLHSLSRERFIFDNSLSKQQDSQGNPFAEPIPLYTNFDKGFGLFSLLNVSRYFVKIK